ncbi:MAG TPA: serine/threonine-protein kinase [Thermoanaerobaculia bacterium]|nr:serine/threonine-protein kinase [Thermoanaerobaculia bacterium]
MVDTASALPTKIGKYEVLGVIGRGGMGVVYKARDPFIDRIVAIKTIRIGENECDDDQLNRLRMEARSAGKLHHPNIVTIFDFGEENEVSYIVMEFVEGINLSRVVQKHRPIPLAARLDVIMQTARGLSYAHESGVVHRDMKPSNICVTARGVAKILDFGLARFDNTRLTKTGYLSGTIAYMSPERFSGETGPQDDIFALGAVAYEFLTYRRAFPGDTTPEIISKILGGPMPARISDQSAYPAELDTMVFRALDRDPAARYQSAAEFVQALDRFMRSHEYQSYVDQESEMPDFDRVIDWTEDSPQQGPNPYSSERSLGSVEMGNAPTLQIGSEIAEPSGTDVNKPAGEPTILKTKPHPQRAAKRAMTQPAMSADAGTPTEFVPEAPRRRSSAWIAVAAAALIAIVVVAILLTRGRAPEAQVARSVTPTATTATVSDAASRQTEVQLATATTLANLVARRQLTANERTRFAEANARLDMARAKIAQKDYASGATLANEAIETFRDLLSSSGGVPSPQAVEVREKPQKKQKPPVIARTETVAPVVTLPPPVVTATQPPVVATQPPPPPPRVETVAPQRPTRAELEREIHAFMREVAAAYQEKDIAFFRQRALNYSDQLASAIRNSPSTRVEIAVNSIELVDDQTARVAVRRTDRFAEAGVPPAVQNLTYELRRLPDGWKIVRFSRI